jgi:two-component SAPR family response regulator
LEDVEDPLFDKYKQGSEETVFSVAPKYTKASYDAGDYQQVIRICQVVLARDPLNEEAFFYCLYAYKKLNEFENVLKVYASFTLEYRKSMGEDYQKTLEEILKKM